jgi:hypothetical protein
MRTWKDGNIRLVIMRHAIDNILPKINVVNTQKIEIYDFPLCDLITLSKGLF